MLNGFCFNKLVLALGQQPVLLSQGQLAAVEAVFFSLAADKTTQTHS